ncbi:hypothetical protein ATANTOWER_001316 [Ataeniobius toweri]|uniref:Uncharacterized protein n=1 Tax=Ataeniobius toweri TaxID=208326 RepID=A0ABU7BWK6_9TELE|nr:hypothetical protein [Ataeniobius toweri]
MSTLSQVSRYEAQSESYIHLRKKVGSPSSLLLRLIRANSDQTMWGRAVDVRPQNLIFSTRDGLQPPAPLLFTAVAAAAVFALRGPC